MLNYEVDPTVLAGCVPRGTELDTWNDSTHVSVVGFQFRDARLLGIPVPLHRDFEEVNLRFYVRRHVGEEVRRGVVFIRELVPRRLVAWAARRFYNENYLALPMSHRDEVGARPDPYVGYAWRLHGQDGRVGVRVSGQPDLPEEGSEAQFITEHYGGYVTQRGGTTLEYRVEHPPWRVWRAVEADLVGDLAALYGPTLAHALSVPPRSAFLCDGSPVVVRRGRALAGSVSP
jgi:hypothetical protein